MARLDRWRRVDSRLLFGLAVLVFGVALTLDNLHLVAAGRVLRLWPGVLGIWALAKAIQHRKDPGVLFWGAAATFGLLLLGSRLRYIRWNIFLLWPVALVLFGAAIIWRVFSPRRYGGPGHRGNPTDALSGSPATASGNAPDSVIDIFTLFRATERSAGKKNHRPRASLRAPFAPTRAAGRDYDRAPGARARSLSGHSRAVTGVNPRPGAGRWLVFPQNPRLLARPG